MGLEVFLSSKFLHLRVPSDVLTGIFVHFPALYNNLLTLIIYIFSFNIYLISKSIIQEVKKAGFEAVNVKFSFNS